MSLSKKELQRRFKLRCICLLCHRYMRMSSVDNLSAAMAISWAIITGGLYVHHTKIRGVTFGQYRQKLISRLKNYPDNHIRLSAVRAYDNPYDRYAIEIYASVKGKGTACLGYVSKQLAEGLAYLMDEEGAWVLPVLENVTGGGKGKAFGVNINFVVVK